MFNSFTLKIAIIYLIYFFTIYGWNIKQFCETVFMKSAIFQAFEQMSFAPSPDEKGVVLMLGCSVVWSGQHGAVSSEITAAGTSCDPLTLNHREAKCP